MYRVNTTYVDSVCDSKTCDLRMYANSDVLLLIQYTVYVYGYIVSMIHYGHIGRQDN